MTTTAEGATTGIGSLPHHNADAALEFSFRMDIPFLPQIPIRNPWEYMIAQALEGLPGLQAEDDGTVSLDTDIWLSRASAFGARLEAAFAPGGDLAAFEPSASISSCWQPFVWELGERGARLAKIQIAGPMTCQWALRLEEDMGAHPELGTQIFRLVLARALAMSRRLKEQGVQPLLYLDEPGLYGFTLANPRHVLGLQQLKLVIQALRKEGVRVGLHCCGNTDWKTILGLPLDYLSLDAGLSLGSLLEQRAELRRFVAEGGRLSLGIVPTSRPGDAPSHPGRAAELAAGLRSQLLRAFPGSGADEALVQRVLTEALYTPACGLALHTVADAERVQELLGQVRSQLRTHELAGQA